MAEPSTTTSHDAARPLVSVALATYNGVRHLEQQLASIEAQSYPAIEIVIADDGSSDGTQELLVGRTWRRPHRVVATHGRAGVIGNFSRALAACRGNRIALCDQDDVWHVDKVALLVDALDGLRAGDARPALVFSDIEVVDSQLHRIARSFFRLDHKSTRCSALGDFLLTNHVPGCAMLFDRALLDRAMPIPLDFHMHDWWLILVAAAFGRIGYVDRPLMSYRQHGANVFGAVGRRSKLPQKIAKVGSLAAWRRYLLPSSARIDYTVRNLARFEERFAHALPPAAAADLARFKAGGTRVGAAWRFVATSRTGERPLYAFALLRAAARRSTPDLRDSDAGALAAPTE